MNVLVLNGSPKGENSNTLRLTRAFVDGAGWTDAEFIDVHMVSIKACLGCFACWNKTPGECVIQDDMRDILTKLIAADVVVWSFPLYYFSVPGSLKNLIDRQLPMNLPFMVKGAESGGHPSRYDLTRQRHVVISTCGFWTAKGNYGSVTAMFDHFCGAGNYAAVFCGQGELFRVTELRNRTEEYLELVQLAGTEYMDGGISENTAGKLAEPLFPRGMFEKMADASWGVSEDSGQPADESLTFTKQMAALYRPDGGERVLEFTYTDIHKSYQILLTKDGSEVIADHFKPFTTKIETPFSVWCSIARGEISGSEALFRQQYKVHGDFSLMLRWDELFGDTTQKKKTAEKKRRKTNMSVLLLPWIVIWVAMAISPEAGGTAGVLAAAALPLLWLIFQPVIYEQISVPIIAALSLLALFGVDVRIVLPVSYGVFGLMWFCSAFAHKPLTSYYSAANYGEEKAFSNPLFMRTNQILTAAWGLLYLVTPIWTYFLMDTGLSAYTGLINSICPAFLGVFTAWFQKWYPARRARG